MDRRKFLGRSLVAMSGPAALSAAPAPAAAGSTTDAGCYARRCKPLAGDYTVLWKTSDPMNEIGYCPALARLPDGRLIGNILHAGKTVDGKRPWTVKIHTSDDRGRTWVHRKDVSMIDSFPFVAGSSAYVIGGREDLKISRSDDNGTTWSDAVPITGGKYWYSHPGSAVYANGRIYFAMEYFTKPPYQGFPVHNFAPVVLSAKVDDDLTRADAWTFSNVLGFQDVLAKYGKPNLFGVPFYSPGRYENPHRGRHMHEIGWGESNLVRFTDPEHIWCDPAGHTFHIFTRARTGMTNVACMAKAVESDDGKTITVSVQEAPSGEPMLFVPFPGGHLSFHIVYDGQTGLFWMISSQSTDSMKRVELLEPKRYNMPNNERHRLALHFSKNCIDWCFAGLVAKADDVGQSRHGGNMIVDGSDLHILMRSADETAFDAHNSNMLTFHTVKNFRDLVY